MQSQLWRSWISQNQELESYQSWVPNSNEEGSSEWPNHCYDGCLTTLSLLRRNYLLRYVFQHSKIEPCCYCRWIRPNRIKINMSETTACATLNDCAADQFCKDGVCTGSATSVEDTGILVPGMLASIIVSSLIFVFLIILNIICIRKAERK